MKFSCNKCHAKYAIADEKVRGKVLKIRCKKCQAIIVVREIKRKADGQVASKTSAPGIAKKPASPAKTHPAQAKKPRAQILPSKRQDAADLDNDDDDADESTRITSSEEISSLLASLGGSSQKSKAPQPVAAKNIPLQWYVAVNGEQSAAMTREDLATKIRQGLYGPKAHVWNKTMSGWIRLAKLPEFAADLSVGVQAVVDSSAEPKKSSRQPKSKESAAKTKKETSTSRSSSAAKSVAKSASKPTPTAAIDALDQIAEMASGIHQSLSSRVEEQKKPEESATQASLGKESPSKNERDTIDMSQQKAAGSVEDAKDLSASEEASDGVEDLFFDPASIQTFSGQVAIDKGEEEADRAYSGPHNVDAFDPFALVDDALPPELPKRESTRVFVAAAGLKNRARKQKIYAAIGISAALLIVGTIGLDAIGWIEIPLLHDYVQSVKIAAVGGHKKTKVDNGAWRDDGPPLTESEKAAIRQALLVGDTAAAAAVKRRARARARAKKIAAAKANAVSGTGAIDLSDNVNGMANANDTMGRHGSSGAVAVELSEADRSALNDLVKHSDKQQVKVQIKPSVGRIRIPKTYSGGLQPKQISEVFLEGQRGIQFCATQEAKRGLELPPAVNIELSIETNGAVSRARILNATKRNSPFGRCLAQKVKNWKFPSFTGQAMDVEIPLKFTQAN